MTESVTFRAFGDQVGRRVDVAIANAGLSLSRTLAHALIDEGLVHVNGKQVKASFCLSEGDEVLVKVVRPPSITARPEPIPLDIVYQDSDLAVLDKPAGLVVHPAPGHWGGTVANGLAALFPQTKYVGDAERPGIVHRLDKNTSGLMVVALNARAHASLQQQIALRTAKREYIALVWGGLRVDSGTIDAPIGRDVRDRKRMAVHGIGARAATTSYRVLETFGPYTLIEVMLGTGRTHQIRVHLAGVGHPLVGDSTYGGRSALGLRRQFLHAFRLSLDLPATGERRQFTSDLPGDLRDALALLRKDPLGKSLD